MVHVWHSDIHPTGEAYVKFIYEDGSSDKIIFHGNGCNEFKKADGEWTGGLGVGEHSETVMSELGLAKQYRIECTKTEGQNTWEYESLSGGLQQIELEDSAEWGGLRDVTITYKEPEKFGVPKIYGGA